LPGFLVNKKLQLFCAGAMLLGVFWGVYVWREYADPEHRQRRRSEAHAQGEILSRMHLLYIFIDAAASTDSERFAAQVGTGLVANAYELSESVMDLHWYTVDERLRPILLRDRWQRPFNVAIRPVIGTNLNTTNFEVLVWSSGANGVDENRKGDDLFLPWRWLELHLPLSPYAVTNQAEYSH
jgi:hypothetical protein